MRRYLMVTGVVLIALMTTLEPDVGFTAPPAARLLFWTLQVGTGLVALQTVLYALTRRFGATRVSSVALVLLSGVLGAVVLAPIYWLIGEGMMEQWLGYAALPDDDGEQLFGIAIGNPFLEEYVQIVGPVTASWALICLPRLHWLVPPLLVVQPQALVARSTESEAGACTMLPLATDRSEPIGSTRQETSSSVDSMPAAGSPEGPALERGVIASSSAAPTWCRRLPHEMGEDVIAVASELQYLRVWTSRGCALILGALADVEAEGGSEGLRVHRSWWVASKHVVGVRRTPTGASCMMSNGIQIPVSRRRRAEVLARFGDSAQYRLVDASESVSQPELHR